MWGWFVLLALGAAGIILIARGLYPFLAHTEPVGARVLAVEGWIDAEGLDQAIAAFRSGGYIQVVTTGGPIEQWPGLHGYSTYAERAADYLTHHGVSKTQVTAVPAPKSAQDRTFLSAVMVREWAKGRGLALDALDVFSLGPHARRSRLLYQLAFGPRVAIGVYAARTNDYDAGAWWRTSIGARDVLTQAVGWLWVKCFFRAPSRNSHEELWATPPRKQSTPFSNDGG